MGKKPFPPNVIQQARQVVIGWNQITPLPAFGSLSAASLADDIAKAEALEAQVSVLMLQLINMRNQRDAHFRTTWDNTKRARSSIKGSFGDDSSQYKLVGGTPLSDRKPYRRKAKE